MKFASRWEIMVFLFPLRKLPKKRLIKLEEDFTSFFLKNINISYLRKISISLLVSKPTSLCILLMNAASTRQVYS